MTAWPCRASKDANQFHPNISRSLCPIASLIARVLGKVRSLFKSSWLMLNYLLTGCKGRTRKYKPKVFHTARACESCLENQGLVFPGTARAPS